MSSEKRNQGAPFGSGSRRSDQAASHLDPAGLDPLRKNSPPTLEWEYVSGVGHVSRTSLTYFFNAPSGGWEASGWKGIHRIFHATRKTFEEAKAAAQSDYESRLASAACVSDGNRNGEDRDSGLSAKHASAVPNGQTPSPSLPETTGSEAKRVSISKELFDDLRSVLSDASSGNDPDDDPIADLVKRLNAETASPLPTRTDYAEEAFILLTTGDGEGAELVLGRDTLRQKTRECLWCGDEPDNELEDYIQRILSIVSDPDHPEWQEYGKTPRLVFSFEDGGIEIIKVQVSQALLTLQQDRDEAKCHNSKMTVLAFRHAVTVARQLKEIATLQQENEKLKAEIASGSWFKEADIDALLRRITELEKERDEWKRLCDEGGKVEVYWSNRAEAAEAQVATLQQKTAGLEETLRRVHPNPADYRYWEGRYRDEAARAEALQQENEKLKAEMASGSWFKEADIDALLRRITELEKERDEARTIVACANNSAFGSHGYFTEASAGRTLAEAIEDLKADCRMQFARAEKAEAALTASQAERDRLKGEVERKDKALEEIAALDYRYAATNGCASKANRIARTALSSKAGDGE